MQGDEQRLKMQMSPGMNDLREKIHKERRQLLLLEQKLNKGQSTPKRELNGEEESASTKVDDDLDRTYSTSSDDREQSAAEFQQTLHGAPSKADIVLLAQEQSRIRNTLMKLTEVISKIEGRQESDRSLAKNALDAVKSLEKEIESELKQRTKVNDRLSMYDRKIHEMQDSLALLNARKHSEEATVDKLTYFAKFPSTMTSDCRNQIAELKTMINTRPVERWRNACVQVLIL
eukprot:768207-Hanusia_phi.AAC.4